ncbi:ketopantoate reductase family protein [Larsenimonas rhizosphaerae]|uniref:2-dehydropantoate 2-reductase n=1 Tax=Larsenimonas rhizosphaerae TaxID=2944682 RepID=A0AA42CXG9_9GAMM|nr:ketopantoate reductase family protein [Larsenimonas rhizosphaerae]MCM2131145.1 ketopantoate reductase family protein [Larsenimonas rhizosphaerae]MCX2523850.1 ketopantoate reductase family protein [Larsenimonas rhizosphaerae]
MKIAVLGAGAVGCFFGGLLAEQGQSVILITRPAHAEAITSQGLGIHEGERTRFIHAVKATTDSSALADAGLVLCCVKADQVVQAAEAIRTYTHHGVPVLALQNGLTSADHLANRLPDHQVWPVLVYAAIGMKAAGIVAHRGGHTLCLDQRARATSWHPSLVGELIALDHSDDMTAARWRKLIVNCVLNALSAVAQKSYGELMQVPSMMDVMDALFYECAAVAAACEVAIDPGLRDDILHIVRTMPEQYSSTAQDIARGRVTEIEEFNGFIMQKGREHQVPTPVNTTLYTLTKAIEVP